MSETKKLYVVKLALKGRLYDTVKIQTEKLESIPSQHKILSYKLVQIKSNS